MKSFCALSMFLVLLCGAAVGQRADSLASRPPMGWNSWNHFATKVTEADVRSSADAMVSSGLRDAGYVYINIDDSWEGKRDSNGVIHSNEKFPDMKALADYVHSKGLKLGIYSSPGPKTCAGYEGSYGHEEDDAKTYAQWGIDYLKYDECSFSKIREQLSGGDVKKGFEVQRQAYEKMHQALLSTGRPIVYSFCQYGYFAPWKWAAQTGGQLWRTTEDISDKWDRMSIIGFQQDGLENFAGPGHWNDPDMLEVGNGGMTSPEYEVHMTLWAMLAAPLLAGNDLSKMTEDTKRILMNKDVIAIDQDALGAQGHRIWVEGPLEIWVKKLSGGKRAIAMFNRNESALTLTVPAKIPDLQEKQYRDLWKGGTVDLKAGMHIDIPRHTVVLLQD